MKDIPLHVFRFHVSFTQQSLANASGDDVALCRGAFSGAPAWKPRWSPR